MDATLITETGMAMRQYKERGDKQQKADSAMRLIRLPPNRKCAGHRDQTTLITRDEAVPPR